MRPSLVAFAFLALAGCTTPVGETQNRSATSGEELAFSQEYGLCADRCYSDITVGENGTARLMVRERGGGAVRHDATVKLSREETAQLFALAHAAAAQPWEEQYGCPNCADQGTYELTLRTDDGDERRTVIDPADHPASFDAVVAALRAIMQRELPQ